MIVSVIALLTIFIGAVAGDLVVKNHCNANVYIYLSEHGSCNFGKGGLCFKEPWNIAQGGSERLPIRKRDMGVSVKMSKGDPDFKSGLFQFEYCHTEGRDPYNGLYWNLSDLDGKGASLVGSPFYHDHVKVTPSGRGFGQGDCVTIRCAADQTCYNSFQFPEDNVNVNYCPLDTGDFTIDLCLSKQDLDAGNDRTGNDGGTQRMGGGPQAPDPEDTILGCSGKPYPVPQEPIPM
ncbi:hypothetical protein QBC41DRAFT_395904 [Cercophora samala]|uniref:Uncharacterized protein n=1 Tax=Cercophora samala TaxID=330535 RepID=A0AA40DB58_9PEZI|nr:hypothetical protein QBC41DRAFT_395904 [Cercophora samala]